VYEAVTEFPLPAEFVRDPLEEDVAEIPRHGLRCLVDLAHLRAGEAKRRHGAA